MKDIDFDELDKAVSSIMGGSQDDAEASQVSPAASTPAAPPVTDEPVPAPAAAAGPAVAQPIVPQRKNLTAAPGVQRSGKFMDIVHPGAGSKPTTQLVKPPVAPAVPAAVETPETPVAAPIIAPDDVPVTTPFVPDAQVDKRPLGAFTPPESAEVVAPPQEPLVAETTSTPEVDTSSISATPEEPAVDASVAAEPADAPVIEKPDQQDLGVPPNAGGAVLPKELSSEMVAVDANEHDVFGSSPASTEEAGDTAPAPVATKEDNKDTPAAQQTTDSVPAVPSIPQQYTPEKEAADPETHSVFDTKAYHQPLKAEAKSHSWIWAVLVVALLGVGAAVGAFFFTAGL